MFSIGPLQSSTFLGIQFPKVVAVAAPLLFLAATLLLKKSDSNKSNSPSNPSELESEIVSFDYFGKCEEFEVLMKCSDEEITTRALTPKKAKKYKKRERERAMKQAKQTAAVAAAARIAALPPPPVCCICISDDNNGMLHLDSCTHSAHLDCLLGQLSNRWGGKRISFAYMGCGECRTPLAHSELSAVIASHTVLRDKVEAMCVEKCREDGLVEGLEGLFRESPKAQAEDDLDELVVSIARMFELPGDVDDRRFEGENAEVIELALAEKAVRLASARALCMSTVACYPCGQCQEPFTAGRVDCGEDDELDVTTLKCPPCAFKAQKDANKCRNHGYKFAVYKCDSCCSVAIWDCRSNHYCERCHSSPHTAKNFKCPGLADCPLGTAHPPNKPGVHGQVDDGFVIGCIKCFSDVGPVATDVVEGDAASAAAQAAAPAVMGIVDASDMAEWAGSTEDIWMSRF